MCEHSDMPDDEAYDPRSLELVNITYRDYVLQGARSSPVGVRFGETHSKNAESDPMTAPMVLRRARSSRKISKHSATQLPRM